MNFGLEVLGRRPDGYHELRTILQTVDFHDELRFEEAESGIRLTTNLPSLGTGRENLVYRAAALLAEAAGVRGGAFIHLEKRVPPGKGLGGGSSDAAATLVALDRLWNTRASPSELHRLSVSLGMDVPFFLHGGTALAVSRGEEVYPLEGPEDLPIVLILPDFSISTADAYGNLRLTKSEADLKLQPFSWNLPEVRVGLRELVNDLESAAGAWSDSIQEYKRLLLDLGAESSIMSGSGSSVLGIFHDEASARGAVRSLGLRGIEAVATKTVGGRAYRAERLKQLASSGNKRSEEASEP
ncbi:MAG TPA: 4-(cytidine 5'-diphospho)-2-C-methyl-D-erythritol kinase [Vicinamibacteria bacterium]|nr:4-(cytidine 5'-diphospho)-2-C-methyl-D-erythritol kinase [Vicinamibacteria bacterium]